MLEAVPTIPFQLPPPRPAAILPLSNACSSPRLGMKQNQKQNAGGKEKSKTPGTEGKKGKRKKDQKKVFVQKKKLKSVDFHLLLSLFFSAQRSV